MYQVIIKTRLYIHITYDHQFTIKKPLIIFNIKHQLQYLLLELNRIFIKYNNQPGRIADLA
ncbi:hypothetical protein AYY18_02450 [Morganella psychrotolerans]|uniref:Uncharacterized protein n=1 Tax=Morganella psychrotolerans TaxID=368603 RepID=A0A1B8HN32_9GAMM|nr:hypothetical protein AYY18_02450 [Morganella psychrotolerans]